MYMSSESHAQSEFLISCGTHPTSDEYWMRRALVLADLAAKAGEVPVGAVLVKDGREIATGWNRPIGNNDPTAHAEIVALRVGAMALGNYRLPGAWLYVTLEPCAMCAGAIIQARIAGVVFGASDPKAGAAGSVFSVLGSGALNHQPICKGNVLAEEAGSLLRGFFSVRRNSR
uniref:tRNA-specific adenosine deaminase n=1 Tax=Candidatus Kentrum sp. TUN TaxID=2126343 RepID=A0A450ZMQ0_9GAMM|nr:MAG: tRNA(adenine34) deaminase [Candidatus Kentron sp. TUN]VFK55051.1 MAG: tRNA(adenine34) deaminase [Candidatus Kentron sp. TUN]VFK55820.1 MAG: tRNA(adenine34) deaminase [Candidatus Kentron sp. TUN]